MKADHHMEFVRRHPVRQFNPIGVRILALKIVITGFVQQLGRDLFAVFVNINKDVIVRTVAFLGMDLDVKLIHHDMAGGVLKRTAHTVLPEESIQVFRPQQDQFAQVDSLESPAQEFTPLPEQQEAALAVEQMDSMNLTR